MRLMKKLGYPMMLVSIFLFSFASRSDGMTLNWIAAAVMLLGMIFFVAGVFVRDPEGAALEAKLAELEREAGPAAGRSPSAVPEPDGIDVPDTTPAWVYITAFVVSVSGAVLYFAGPNGVSVRTVTTFAMMPAGVIFALLARLFYGDEVRRRNMLRGAVSVVGFLLAIGGIFTGVLLAAGAFDTGEARYYGYGALGGLVLGLFMIYFSLKYQQSEEAVAIGRQFGFEPTDPGATSSDGEYDSKGVINGVETLFNVEQREAYKHTPAGFALNVLCRCANPLGVRLHVKPEGLLSAVNLSGLQNVPPVDHWDFYEIRSNMPDSVVKPLAAARVGENVFTEQAGFTGMTLEGNEFKFDFFMEGHAGPAYVKRVLQEVSKLAASF